MMRSRAARREAAVHAGRVIESLERRGAVMSSRALQC